MTASAAIDAAVEAVKAAAVASAAATTDDAVWQLNDDTEYFNMSGIYSENVPELVRIVLDAAAHTLLAAAVEELYAYGDETQAEALFSGRKATTDAERELCSHLWIHGQNAQIAASQLRQLMQRREAARGSVAGKEGHQ